MPLKNGRFSVQETKFVEAYAGTRNVQQAAKIAGYAHADHGYQVLRKPAVLQAIQETTVARLTGELAPLAVNTLKNVMEDPHASTAHKLTAANTALKYAMPLAIEGGQVKDISEMSSAELQLLTISLRREQEEREAQAKTIELAPDSAQDLPDFLQ